VPSPRDVWDDPFTACIMYSGLCWIIRPRPWYSTLLVNMHIDMSLLHRLPVPGLIFLVKLLVINGNGIAACNCGGSQIHDTS